MQRFSKLSTKILQFAMISGPSLMVIAMLLIAPQQQLLGSLEGTNLFLRSIAGEPGAWHLSHVAMLFAAVVFPLAFIGLYRSLIPCNFWFAIAGLFFGYVGAVLLIGQLAIDFVYGALVANSGDLDAARSARQMIVNASTIQVAFNMVANIGLVVGWAIAAIMSLIYNAPSRLFGVLVLLGWLTIILLSGKIPYVEAVGHGMMAAAMILAVRKQNEA